MRGVSIISTERYLAVCAPLIAYRIGRRRLRYAVVVIVASSVAFNTPRFFEFRPTAVPLADQLTHDDERVTASTSGAAATMIVLGDTWLRYDEVYQYAYNTTLYLPRRGLPVRLQHGLVLRRRLRRSAARRRRLQPAPGRVARRRAAQLGDAELVAEARAARHATSGRHRARLRRLRLRVAARLRPRRRLRVGGGGGRRPLPAVAAGVHGRQQLPGRLQRRRQLPADALLRQEVPPDAQRRRSLSKVADEDVAGGGRGRVDHDGSRAGAIQIDRRLSRDDLLTVTRQ